MIARQQSKGMLSIERYTNTLNVFRVVESVVTRLLVRISQYLVFCSKKALLLNHIWFMWPILLTWIKFNHSMDK